MGSTPLPPPRPRLRWGLGDAVLGLAVALAVGLVATEIAIGVTHLKARPDGSYPETIPLLVAGVVGQDGAWLAMLVWTSMRKGLGTLRADFGLVVDIVADWWMVPVGLVGSIVAGLVLEPITNLVNQTPQQIVQDLDTAHGAKLAIIAVTAVLVAPVVEELFFRGLLLRALQRRFSAPVAVTISAIAFGALHLLGDVHAGAVLPALVALGMVSGILAVRTGNLSRSILLHAGFNLLAVASALRR